MVNHARVKLDPGLYLVATPIGTARDVTLHALDLLASADLLVAEDTRSLRHLMQIHGVPLAGRQVRSYHDHSGAKVRDDIIDAIQAGHSVVYAPEAGTAMVADPGYDLARAVTASGGTVRSAPGPSAMLVAVTLSGLPSDRVMFCGFPPQKGGARAEWLAELIRIPATLVFYEAPGRVRRLLAELDEAGQGAREAALCRELTKRFEEVLRDSVGGLRGRLGDQDPRGECVLLLGPPVARTDTPKETVEEALDDALERLSLKDAVAEIAEIYDLPRREVYQSALSRRKARNQ